MIAGPFKIPFDTPGGVDPSLSIVPFFMGDLCIATEDGGARVEMRLSHEENVLTDCEHERAASQSPLGNV